MKDPHPVDVIDRFNGLPSNAVSEPVRNFVELEKFFDVTARIIS